MKELPVRKSIRLKGYDYSQVGYYFVTMCVRDRHEMFGEIIDGKMEANEYGKIAERNLINIPVHVKGVFIDNHIVMPNHVHIIVRISENVGTRYIASAKPDENLSAEPPSDDERTPYMASLQIKSKQTLSRAMQQYKASVTRDTAIVGLWQPRFYDEIIHSDEDYQRIWHYINNNPTEWAKDDYFGKE